MSPLRFCGESLRIAHSIQEDVVQKITPFLWFDTQAEEAASFYASVFKNSKIGSMHRYDEEGAKASGRPKGSVMTASFQLEGQNFVALNGGPNFKFTEAISFVISCENQEEVDHYWSKLSEGGDEKAQQCGWLKDKFGISWQIVPVALNRMLGGKDPRKAKRVMQVLLQMKKLDIAALERAYEQE
jgi:predicted 3-demethylubiquinone-9 3-methyltransferase (glyoxalase superfamily)